MSNINVRLIPLATGGSGTGSIHVTTSGLVRSITVIPGTLVSPHLAITDGLTGVSILAKDDIATATRFLPLAAACDATGTPIAATYTPPVITGRMDIAISAAGNNHLGQLIVVLER